MPLPSPINTSLDNTIYQATMLEIFKGKDIVAYVPFDPYTFKIPDTIQDFKQRHITKNYYITYSPNCHKIYNQYGKLPILFVNYTLPISYQYYGQEEPPERSIEEQYNDWKNGYQLSRIKLPNQTWTEEKLEKLEKILERPIPRGYYWVKHHARLIELPKDITNMKIGIIKLTYIIPSPLATTPFIKNIYEYFSKEKEKIVQNAVQFIQTCGFQIDEELQYKVGNKTYKGIQILTSQDNKYYEVYLPVKKAVTPQFVQVIYAIVAVIVAVIAYFAVENYMIHSVEIEKLKLEGEKIETEYKKYVINLLNNNPDLLNKVSQNPELAKAILNLTTKLNQDPTGDNIISYLKWGAIGLGALVGGILLITLIQYLPKPKR